MAQLLDGLDVVYAAEEPAESSSADDSDDDSDSLGSGGAAAARAAAVPRGGGGGAAAAVVAENGLASLRRARLAPGVFGAAVALRKATDQVTPMMMRKYRSRGGCRSATPARGWRRSSTSPTSEPASARQSG